MKYMWSTVDYKYANILEVFQMPNIDTLEVKFKHDLIARVDHSERCRKFFNI